MLLRFIVKNFLSFKEETEFNMFPSSKTQSFKDHILDCDYAQVLRLAALYGANGAGKSNLLAAIAALRHLAIEGAVSPNDFTTNKFAFSPDNKNNPIEFAIEFFAYGHIYYYTLSINDSEVVEEALYYAKKNRDELIFSRKNKDIDFGKSLTDNKKNKIFVDAIKDTLLRPDSLLLTFMARNYPSLVEGITSAYIWIASSFEFVLPDSTLGAFAHVVDKNPSVHNLLNDTIRDIGIGVDRFEVKKTAIDESQLLYEEMKTLVADAKKHPGEATAITLDPDQRVLSSLVYEDGRIVIKELEAIHKVSGKEYKMPLASESDGTLRMLDYIPLIYEILHSNKVYIVDEIERSIHPILIKAIIEKISQVEDVKGQLIFSTHEACLLDQKLLRPDEIWFAEKNLDQSTELYPLSDFQVHKTANIQLGYLQGRYGAIPFLSNLNDLSW